MTVLSGAAVAGCEFSWANYGDNQIRDIVSQQIGGHVPDKFCPYAAKYQIVLQFNAYTLRDSCVGHAIASLRRKGSKVLPEQSYSNVFSDTSCRTSAQAQALAASASYAAIDALMANLENYGFSD